VSEDEFNPADRLIVALDLPGVDEADVLVERIGEAAGVFKIGYQLAPLGGFDLARRLTDQGRKVFLDLKFHDIGATVEKGVKSVRMVGADFLTVHGEPDVIRAAVAGRGDDERLKILVVTVLTNLAQADLDAAGYNIPLAELVLQRARAAQAVGADGVIASAREAHAIRAATSDDFLIVTPGIRPTASAASLDQDDQKRVATPAEARAAGASHIVVGRPVTMSPDPAAAARAIAVDFARG